MSDDPGGNLALEGLFHSLSSPFPGGSDGKESACKAGDLGSIPGLGRSLGEGNLMEILWRRLPTPVLLLGKFHGQSVVGYSPRSHKELDTMERISFFHFKVSLFLPIT